MTRHAFWLLLVIGCASPMSAMRDDNRRLNTTVTELRADRRAQDRKLRDLQHQLDAATRDAGQRGDGIAAGTAGRGRRAAAGQRRAPMARASSAITETAPRSSTRAMPPLGKSAMIEDDAPAPRRARARLPRVIEMGSPSGTESRRMPRRVGAQRARDDAGARVAPSAPMTRGADYRAAVELVKAGKHDEAVAALRAFLQHYPRHDYADNAQYWLGEAFYAQKDYQHALAEFRTTYRDATRAATRCPTRCSKWASATRRSARPRRRRPSLEQVVNLYPKTEPAALAAKRLETP